MHTDEMYQAAASARAHLAKAMKAEDEEAAIKVREIDIPYLRACLLTRAHVRVHTRVWNRPRKREKSRLLHVTPLRRWKCPRCLYQRNALQCWTSIGMEMMWTR